MDNYMKIIEHLEYLSKIPKEEINNNFIEEDENEYVTYSLKHELKKGTNVIKLKHNKRFIKVNIEIKKNKIFIPYEQNGNIITKDIIDKISSILYEEMSL